VQYSFTIFCNYDKTELGCMRC